jgi:hypothetical protein
MPAEKICPVCEKKFPIKPSHVHRRVYCSKSCVSTAQKTTLLGEKNPNYRGTKTKYCDICKSSFDSYNTKRKFCSKKHELFKKALNHDAFWNEKNLQVLCRKCNWEKELDFRKSKLNSFKIT